MALVGILPALLVGCGSPSSTPDATAPAERASSEPEPSTPGKKPAKTPPTEAEIRQMLHEALEAERGGSPLHPSAKGVGASHPMVTGAPGPAAGDTATRNTASPNQATAP